VRLLPAAACVLGLAAVPGLAQTLSAQQTLSAKLGYASPVSSPQVVAMVTARFGKGLAGLGISATVTACRLMARGAGGGRGSDTAYGAACHVVTADGRPREVLRCDDDFGETFAMVATGFVDTPEWMEGFVRRTCF
jgi:hypothetical protein